MSKQTPSASTVSAVGPCPTVIQIVGRPGTGSLPSTIAPPKHSRYNEGPLYTIERNSQTNDQQLMLKFRRACMNRFFVNFE